jgi:tetratricopeptide (TPR) repeat protein
MSAAASLTHLPFFEALAAEADEASPAWRRLSAGLVVLRAFDGWLRHVRRGDPPLEAARLRAARDLAEAMDGAATERPVLVGLADAMLAHGGRVDVVRGHLLAYARRLQLDARWRLAADVYRTFVEARDPLDVSTDAIEGAFQCGYCYRMDGDVEEAAVAYDLGEALATAAGDRYGMLRARVCQAKLSAQRGNLPAAEAALDAVIRDAEAAGERRGLALALTDRMAVAGQRGRPEEAAVFGFRALHLCDDALAREPILSDVATALGEAGHREAARDAHLTLASTAHDPRVRLLASLNLLELSVDDGDELAFGRYRRLLADAPLPVPLRAKYHLVVGDGFRTFGNAAAAHAAYGVALRFAEENACNDVVFRAEAALRALARPTAPAAAAEAAGSGVTSIADVIRGVRRLREEVGVAAP